MSHLCDSQSLTFYARDLIRESAELEAEDAATCAKGSVITFVCSGGQTTGRSSGAQTMGRSGADVHIFMVLSAGWMAG